MCGLRYQAIPVIHGSLLVLAELLALPEVSESNMPDNFNIHNINATVMRYSEHRDALLRKTVIQLLPIVAKKDPARFRSHFAAAAVAHLIQTLHKGTSERGMSYLSLAALLPVAGPEQVQPHRDDILALVLDGITPTPRKPLVLEAATCVASLAALDPSDAVVIERMPDLVEQMLAASEGNLAPVLITALSDIVRRLMHATPLLLMHATPLLLMHAQRHRCC